MLSETFSQKYVSCNNSVIHKKELSIMTAVMNKIFKKDGSASDRHTTLDAEANKSVPLANEYMLEESDEASLSDPDNLLTNIGLQQRGDDALDQILLEEAEDPPENQVCKSKYSGICTSSCLDLCKGISKIGGKRILPFVNVRIMLVTFPSVIFCLH